MENVRRFAPSMLFLQKPELAAEEFNVKLCASTSQAATTQTYWAALKHFNEMRLGLWASWGDALAAHKKHGNISQDQEDFLNSINRFATLSKESKAIASLQLKGVDERAVNWAAEYLAWLQKREGLELMSAPDLGAQSQVPGAIAESMLRLGMGDPNYLTPLDEQRRAENQRAATAFENSKSYDGLGNAAADISAHCMKVRAALGKDYNVDFAEIKLQ